MVVSQGSDRTLSFPHYFIFGNVAWDRCWLRSHREGMGVSGRRLCVCVVIDSVQCEGGGDTQLKVTV